MSEQILRERFLNVRKQILEQRFQRMNSHQREAVFQTEGPVLILAGAGSGKTTVLINRIANLLLFGNGYHSEEVPSGLGEDSLAFLEGYLAGSETDETRLRGLLAANPPKPWQILAITFTNKAAAELRARLSAMLGEEEAKEITAATFHSACLRILRAEITRLGYQSGFAIYDSDDQQRVVKEVLKKLNLDDKVFQPRSVLAAIGEAKDRLQTPEEMKEAAGGNFRLEKIAEIYKEYQKRLVSSNAVDFDDIISLTVRLFDENPDVLHKYQRRYRYIMVDEYQDTNRSQYQLVSLLAGGWKNLCVVGDDDQSIYRFRGATIENILSFEEQFEGAKVIRLEENYRSTQTILDAANGVIAHNLARKGKTLWTSNGEGEKVALYTAADERDEADRIASAIAAHVAAGGKYSDNAVLYRLNAQSNTIESTLAISQIPYKVVGGVRFYDRKEIKDMLAYLSVIENTGDLLRLSRIINEPKRGIGDATVATATEIASVLGVSVFDVLASADQYAPLQRKAKALTEFAAMITSLIEAAGTLPLDELLDELLEVSGYRKALTAEGETGRTRLENIEELKSSMKLYESETEEPTLSGFLEEIALFTDLDGLDGESDVVTLMTLHSAKGLEFENVFIAGMEEGIFPSSRSTVDEESLEEERRLAYVGITRAKKNLTLLHAGRRMLFGQTAFGRPSRFLSEIPPLLIQQSGRTNAGRSASGVFPARPGRTPSYSAPRQGFGSGAAAGLPKQAPSAAPVHPGERVLHRVFGEGEVLNVTPMGGDQLVEIRFQKVGVKKIMAAYAKLTPLG